MSQLSSFYKGKLVTVLGRHGFIGSALSKRLERMGAIVSPFPSIGIDFLFNFAGPTHLKFEKNVDYYVNELITEHLYCLNFCKNQAVYVWPSSALVYETDKKTPFKNCKKAMEELQLAYPTAAVGLRIFPVYGPGEISKLPRYRTAIFQFVEQMLRGESPIVYGDGSQARDFIFIDDVIEGILTKAMENSTNNKIVDIGTGTPISFNGIVTAINSVLRTNIRPKYVAAPGGYSKGIQCYNPVKQLFSLEDGIREIIKSLQE